MIYRKGDMVRFLDTLPLNKVYGSVRVLPPMKKYEGTEQVVSYMDKSGVFLIKGEDYFFHLDMLDTAEHISKEQFEDAVAEVAADSTAPEVIHLVAQKLLSALWK